MLASSLTSCLLIISPLDLCIGSPVRYYKVCRSVFNGIFASRMDSYRNFAQLAQEQTDGVDYEIECRRGSSGHAVIAPHGGRIERGTGPLAAAIAGQEHSYYCFSGLKPGIRANKLLHLTSDHFDEPRALALVQGSERVISIHGARGDMPVVYTGGLDRELRTVVMRELALAGITTMHDPSPTRQGRGLSNICNRGLLGAGLQLELSFALRRQIFERGRDGEYVPNSRFFVLVEAIRGALVTFGRHDYGTGPDRGQTGVPR